MFIDRKTVLFVADESAAPKRVFDDFRKTTLLAFMQLTGENPTEGWPDEVVKNLIRSSQADRVVIDEFIPVKGVLSHSASVALASEISISFPDVAVAG